MLLYEIKFLISLMMEQILLLFYKNNYKDKLKYKSGCIV